ncbi:hypothetical protein K5D32_21295 [Pseudomonas cichorii]|uniref:hypothetical protein n=1 Tax=Pseudomonas cichorii TaxID=36746 RepID=UPI001C89B135|nr:hypothetical protein [Pseudomonas cichorii]MBX8532210.1 hypothetical protein [Pseudomonas cichorii]
MKSQGWKIVKNEWGDYVELHLDVPLPVSSRYPTLLIDGLEYEAILSEDRKVLRTTVPVFEVEHVKEVTSPELFLSCQNKHNKPFKKSKRKTSESARLAAPDALSVGPYAVIRYDYDYGDEALELPDGWSGIEFRAAVYMPDSQGVYPVIILLHGRHSTCEFPSDTYWPCRGEAQPIPSFEGYGAAAEALASHGYVVVSLSANGITAYESVGFRGNADRARGHLILAHLDLLSEANKGSRPELSLLEGRLDLDTIGLMGHSRGGSGVAWAVTLNRLLNKNHGIQAAVLLGSTTFDDIAIPGTHTAAILPFLDGDVAWLDAQRNSDISRFAFEDDVFRSSVLLLGANHNYFNTEWSPGSRSGGDDTEGFWGDIEVSRHRPIEQQRLGAFYLAGFFRLVLGREQEFLVLFDGSPITIPTLPRASVQSTAYFPASSRYTVQSFENMHSHDTLLMPGEWDWTITEGVGEVVAAPLPKFGGLRSTHHRRHGFLNLKSLGFQSPAELELHVRDVGSPVDLSLYTHLSFHIDYMQEESAVESVELQVTLDGVTVDLTATLQERWPLPEIINGVETFLQRQISVPLTAFSLKGPVSALTFTLPSGGDIGLSDIVFVKPSLGKNEPLRLPFVSAMKDIFVVATGQEQTLEVEVFLSEASLVRVPMWVSFRIIHRVFGEMYFEEPLVFEPGEQSKTARFTILAGGFRSFLGGEVEGRPCYIVPVKLEALANALFARPAMQFQVLPFP